MRVLVVYCHPNPQSLIGAAKHRSLAALATAGHEIRLTDLYEAGFQPEMTSSERRTHKVPGVDQDLRSHVDDLAWAEALVLIYPTWWSAQPAMLKGWIDRVWVAGVAWTMEPGATRPKPKLRNVRRIVVVTTHGSSKLVNALQGEPGKRVAFRALRSMCARRTRTTWCALYGVDRDDGDARRSFLDRVERTLAELD